MIEKKLAPSMLSADFGYLERDLRAVAEAGADYLHVDVMDGNFVPNISFGPPVIRVVRKIIPELTMDVHLMVEEPGRYIQDYAACGADILTVHAEATKHIHSTLQQIAAAGIRAGVAINPGTPVSDILPVLSMADQVLVMSVNPGYGGQSLIPETLEKVTELVQIRKRMGLSFAIEIDGGVKLSNLDKVLKAGTDVIVAGSAIFGGDIPKEMRAFREIMEAGSMV
ncbi:MAG: ribulose-phosphate 3-epimerase [Eubacterium sp.]|nr:ribulose-phosphate 3-epimerase [Eubacterium sp.]